MALRLFVIRHGETQWSLSGQHTGRADILLTERGAEEARQLGNRIRDISFSKVFQSPLKRAQQTCELAGLSEVARNESDLIEWDNGDYEGRSADEILKGRPGWNIFRDGCPGGEMPDQVSDRVDHFIDALRGLDGDVALFTHGHLGRALAARWIGFSVEFARNLLMGTASLSVLGYQPNQLDQPAIVSWNCHCFINNEC